MDGPSIPYGFTSDKADEFLQGFLIRIKSSRLWQVYIHLFNELLSLNTSMKFSLVFELGHDSEEILDFCGFEPRWIL